MSSEFDFTSKVNTSYGHESGNSTVSAHSGKLPDQNSSNAGSTSLEEITIEPIQSTEPHQLDTLPREMPEEVEMTPLVQEMSSQNKDVPEHKQSAPIFSQSEVQSPPKLAPAPPQVSSGAEPVQKKIRMEEPKEKKLPTLIKLSPSPSKVPPVAPAPATTPSKSHTLSPAGPLSSNVFSNSRGEPKSPKPEGQGKLDSICKGLEERKKASSKPEASSSTGITAKPLKEPKKPVATTKEEVSQVVSAEVPAVIEEKADTPSDTSSEGNIQLLLDGVNASKVFLKELEKMQEEMKKADPDLEVLFKFIRTTFDERQVKFNTSIITIQETLKLFPVLRNLEALNLECELIKGKKGNWPRFAAEIERRAVNEAETELQKINSQLAKKRPIIATGIEKWNVLKNGGDEEAKDRFKKDFGVLCLLSRKCSKMTMQWDQDFFRQRKKNVQLVIDVMAPFIDIEGELFSDDPEPKYKIYVEGLFVLEAVSLFQATLYSYALYWIFNLDYRVEVRGLFNDFDKVF